MTKNRQEYDKQVARIRKIVNQLSSQPNVDLNIDIDELIGETPKHVSKKRIENLKNVTPSKIRAYATFYDKYSGEQVDYHTWRETINNPSDKSYVPKSEENGTADESVIDRIINKIDDLPNVLFTYLTNGNSSINDLSDFKQFLIGAISDNYNSIGADYIDYLHESEAEINTELETLNVKGMYDATYINSTARLEMLVNMGTLSMEASERSHLYQNAMDERLNDYNGITDED